MFRNMRYKERELSREEAIELINSTKDSAGAMVMIEITPDHISGKASK